MPIDNEVKTLIEQVNSGLTTLKSELDGVKEESKKGAEFNAKLDKITDSVTKAAEGLQELERKNTALEAVLNRIDLTGEQTKATPERVKESKAAFTRYLREGDKALEGTN